jgi:tetratricopeptide (TPR) repeat protein
LKKLIFVFCLLPLLRGLTAQDINVDSLKKVLLLTPHDTVKCQVLLELINAEAANFLVWPAYNEQMQQIAEKNLESLSPSDPLYIFYLQKRADAIGNKGYLESSKGNFNKALDYYDQSIVILDKIGRRDSTLSLNNNIATIYYQQGNIAKSLEYFQKSLKLAEKVRNEVIIAATLSNMALLYLNQGDTTKSLEYNFRSLKIKQKVGTPYDIAVSVNNIGYIYFRRGELQKARDYYIWSLKLRESVNDRMGVSGSLNHLAVLYSQTGQPEKALEYYARGLQLSKEVGDKTGVSTVLNNIGFLYYNKGNKEKALKYTQEAMDVAKSTGNPELIGNAAGQLRTIYKSMGKQKEALEAYELYTRMNDSLSNATTKKAAMKNQLQYEYEKKELEAKAKNEQKVARIRLDSERAQARKNNWIMLLVSFAVVLLIGSAFLLNYFRQRHIISTQKESILKQKLLVSQMNPHFIFNSLNAIQNYIFKQDSLKAGTYLSQFAELMRMILDYSRRDLIKLSEEIRLLNNYFELQQLRFEFKFNYTIEVDKELEPSEVLIPPMLAQPFIENAIEHGIFYKEGKGNVYLRISKQEDKLAYEIEDDGVGLERSMELNKQKKMEHKSLATIITKERIDSMEQKGPTDNQIEITDLAKVTPGHTGVKVKFIIPYKEQ